MKIIAGNWKMYKTAKEAKEFIHALLPLVKGARSRILIAPPFTAIHAAAVAAEGSNVEIGAQNMHDAVEGAYTGEISARMLKEVGARFVILGHSERRPIETNAFIHRKIKRALMESITPILCVGETQEERDAGKSTQIVTHQLKECLLNLSAQEISHLMVAYEPVWAIGTGKTATPELAQEMHALIRSHLPVKLPLLYGGSVKPDNTATLLSQNDIDGALVGGASLDVSTFSKIINYR